MAGAISARYGLSLAELVEHLGYGHFQVKAGVDWDSAVRLVADLESLGAVCAITDDAGQIVTHPSAPQPSQAAMYSALSSVQYGEVPEQDLGVLGGGSESLSLATLDGDEPAASPSRGGPVQAYDPSAFAPPEAADEQALQLAVAPRHASPGASHIQPDGLGPVVTGASVPHGLEQTNAPPPAAYPGGGQGAVAQPPYGQAAPGAARRATSQGVVSGGTSASDSGASAALFQVLTALARAPRARFASGVLLAVLLGFVPAHIFASIRESGALADIDEAVNAEQEQVDDLASWRALGEYRAIQLQRKERQRNTIAIGALVIWAVIGGAVSFLWFRRIDWDSYGGT